VYGGELYVRLVGVQEMVEAGVSGEEGAGPSQPSTPVQSHNPAAIIRRALEARTNRYALIPHFDNPIELAFLLTL
jgi:hypothetical protein